ncbi:uncharacterized protein C8Q71DRAFT_721015 [Rhodofomes roseus]|uniref:Uncharacterized protein n=1 Tax=Rhodofomes roseus TaxID=34475 RepID=A0ABQ8KT90_9APHY|nr:uncharacterized protein C8Q71DRAFT_721015 [Rhodofomes roseus]KAH9841972.1 hypothetical protein C8Q71DRAFT_721015 [Rhodofomes roseus]
MTYILNADRLFKHDLASAALTEHKVTSRKWNPREFTMPLVHAPGQRQLVKVPADRIISAETSTPAPSPPNTKAIEEDVTMGSPSTGPADNNSFSLSETLCTEADPSGDSDIEVIESPMNKLVYRKPRHRSRAPSPITISDSEPDRTAFGETGLLFEPSPEIISYSSTSDESTDRIPHFPDSVQPPLQQVIVSEGQQNWTRLPYLFQEGELPEDLIPAGAPLAPAPDDWEPLVGGGGLVAKPEDITLSPNHSSAIPEDGIAANHFHILQHDLADRVVSSMESAPTGRMYTSPAEATAPLDPFHNLWTRDSGKPLQWPRTVIGPSYSGQAPTAFSDLLHQRTILESRIKSLEQLRRSNALNARTVGWVLAYYNCAEWPQAPQQ